MNKQEAIKRVEQMGEYERFVDEPVSKNSVLNIISQIDELQKVTVPKFVAEWIEDHKEDYSKWNEEARADFVFRAINDLFRFGEGLSPWDFAIDEKISDWTTKNAYEFITAILFDYTVKKEKLYTVEIPNPNAGGHVVLCKTSDGIVSIFFTGMARWRGCKNVQLTEAEIKENFEWAWKYAEEVKE